MQDNDKETQILDWLAKSLKAVEGGMISIDIEGQPALKIDVNKEKGKINIDFIQPRFSRPQKMKQDYLIN